MLNVFSIFSKKTKIVSDDFQKNKGNYVSRYLEIEVIKIKSASFAQLC